MELRALRYFAVVAEERNIGRAARRLNMTQPPLSRALRRLEDELGTVLLVRTSSGVELTIEGVRLYEEAVTLLARAEEIPRRISGQGVSRIFRIGILVDSASKELSVRMVGAFRQRHPSVLVWLHEAELADPTAGLRAARVDVALTRTPFDDDGLSTVSLQRRSVGAVLQASDPLARSSELTTADLADRVWTRMPDVEDERYLGYWTEPELMTAESPAVRTVQDGLQAALWNGAVAIAPLNQVMPTGLVCVPLVDREPTSIVVVWRTADPNPLVRSYVDIARSTVQPDDVLRDVPT
jgi:DNA-binding transcriptional LysR family regulator